MTRRPIADYLPFRDGFRAVLGDDNGNQVPAVFSFDDWWMDVSDPQRPKKLGFEPTWFKVPERCRP